MSRLLALILLLLSALAAPAAAQQDQDKDKPAGEPDNPAAEPGKPSAEPSTDPMAAWKPPKVKNEAADRKEIALLFKAMDDAGKKGDLEAAAGLVDFPVLMVTDDSKGQGGGEVWTKEQWTKVMAPFYAKPMTMVVTHKPTVVLMSDSLATVTDAWTMTKGKQKVSGKSTTLLVRRDGEWLVKAMMEGGWGDMPGPSASAEPK